ncbi:MAG: phosphatidylserine decarboxylase [Ignavibacteria bacterium GWB2_35_6b]|nr:MAG: phosphatidylserine decarboxylase [Ignavibacteria bacterium GWB2_35_6b]
MITKYGYNTVGIISVIVFIIFTAAILIDNNSVKYTLFAFGTLLIIFTLNFFRDPERITPADKNVLISPADGKVLLIKKVEPNRYLEGTCSQVSIFMSPLNVHVNRIPIDGKVEYFKYVEGEFLTAFNDKADEKNERTEIGILSKHGKVLFTQVAGFVARRIICDLKVGDTVKAGERFGMIKFGSRVDIIIPENHEILVKEGQNVSAGETIISRIN